MNSPPLPPLSAPSAHNSTLQTLFLRLASSRHITFVTHVSLSPSPLQFRSTRSTNAATSSPSFNTTLARFPLLTTFSLKFQPCHGYPLDPPRPLTCHLANHSTNSQRLLPTSMRANNSSDYPAIPQNTSNDYPPGSRRSQRKQNNQSRQQMTSRAPNEAQCAKWPSNEASSGFSEMATTVEFTWTSWESAKSGAESIINRSLLLRSDSHTTFSPSSTNCFFVLFLLSLFFFIPPGESAAAKLQISPWVTTTITLLSSSFSAIFLLSLYAGGFS